MTLINRSYLNNGEWINDGAFINSSSYFRVLIDWNSDGGFDHPLSNVSDYVRSCNWSLGSNGGRSPFEGTANIVLDNRLKTFTPNDFTKMIPNQKIKILYDGNLMWAGYILEYELTPFEVQDNKTTLKCSQGIFLMQNLDYTWSILDTAKAGTIFNTLIDSITWESAASPHLFRLNRSATVLGTAVLAGDTYLLGDYFNIGDTDSLLGSAYLTEYTTFSDLAKGVIDDGHHTFSVVGNNWSQSETSVPDILTEVAEADKGFWFLDRYNLINYYDRNRLNDTVLANRKFTLGTDTTAAQYQYGKDLKNIIYESYAAKQLIDDVTVWNSYIEVPAGESIVTTITPTVESDSGNTYSIYTIQDFTGNSTWTAYESETDKGTDVSADVRVVILSSNVGEVEFRIDNTGGVDAEVYILMKATVVESASSARVSATDLDSISTYNGQFVATFDNSSMLTTPAQAQNNADYELAEKKDAHGEFNSITVKSFGDWIELIKTLTIGDLVEFTEGQTSETSVRHMIMGESAQYMNNMLTMNYSCRRIVV